MSDLTFDWSELAFGSKKTIRGLKATFIAAPRELSETRFKELVKTCLPHGNIVLGLAKEDYVDGFTGQPQFKTLQLATVQKVIDKVNASRSPYKLYTLSYFQRELDVILQKISMKRVVFMNGSWQYAFHNLPQYYTLANKHIPYDMVSPFVDEAEAKQYEVSIKPWFKLPLTGTKLDERAMLQAANDISQLSYDHCFQTGASLGKKVGDHYTYLTAAFNKVIPYQTYALHSGSQREKYFSQPHDTNHYDTIHAEMALIVEAAQQNIDLRGTTLFINLLPCPNCARTLSQTGISEFVYTQDHSDGYAVKMLELSGKKVRRLV